MERIISEFEDEIVPFAAQLVEQLASQFLRLSAHSAAAPLPRGGRKSSRMLRSNSLRDTTAIARDLPMTARRAHGSEGWMAEIGARRFGKGEQATRFK